MSYFPTGRNRSVCLLCAGLSLIRASLEDYGNNRLPLTDCRVPSQPDGWGRAGGRAADSYHRVAVGDSSHESHDERHLDSRCSWTKSSSETDESTVHDESERFLTSASSVTLHSDQTLVKLFLNNLNHFQVRGCFSCRQQEPFPRRRTPPPTHQIRVLLCGSFSRTRDLQVPHKNPFPEPDFGQFGSCEGFYYQRKKCNKSDARCIVSRTHNRMKLSLEPRLRNYLLSGPARDAAATGTWSWRILAFVLALFGVLGTTVATLLPNWKVSINAWSSIMTPISQMQGLWMDCVWYSSGVFSCTMKNSVLSLPAYLQTMRAAMRTGRPDYPSPAEPDRLLMHREEQRRRELQTEHVPPKKQQNKAVKLQMDKVKQEKPPQEKPGQDHGQKLYSSPSKLPPKDIKDSYSLQEYV
ncbi:Claudin-20 [Collichthys lucidus]|uniref:Claudin-20 n=1 Tax=Collichthys lucidus TaxID=240159 RepID=A0A4U5UKG9_COLLU|nr:Claudin-20 [Collichthys lucidus]